MLHHRHSTAIPAAALRGHEHIVRLLLEPKYRVIASGNEYERSILDAARGGHLCLVQFSMDNAKIVQPTQLKQRILLKACCYGHETIVQMMLDLGSNLNALYCLDEVRSRWFGSLDRNSHRIAESHNPLRDAASHHFHKIVQLLLARGGNPNHSEAFEDCTPLYDAVQGRSGRVSQTLLDHGADINGERFHNFLEVAVRRGSLHVVNSLLERGASLDTK